MKNNNLRLLKLKYGNPLPSKVLASVLNAKYLNIYIYIHAHTHAHSTQTSSCTLSSASASRAPALCWIHSFSTCVSCSVPTNFASDIFRFVITFLLLPVWTLLVTARALPTVTQTPCLLHFQTFC